MSTIKEAIALLVSEAKKHEAKAAELRSVIARLSSCDDAAAVKPKKPVGRPPSVANNEAYRKRKRESMRRRRAAQKVTATSPLPSLKSPHPGGRPIIQRDDGNEKYRERKRRNAAARRARLRDEAANGSNAASPPAPAPEQKPDKPTPPKAVAKFQQWRAEHVDDVPVLDHSTVAS